MTAKLETLLEQRISPLADHEIPLQTRCGICWMDLNEEHHPVKLPCGHIFGKYCILGWALSTTTRGRYKSCPYCFIELLPPSLHSRGQAVRYWVLQGPFDLWNLFDEGPDQAHNLS